MPAVSGLYTLIEENLKYHGFQVINITDISKNFRYPSLTALLSVKWKEFVHKDKSAKKQLKWNVLQAHIKKQIEDAGGADYALLISADIYTGEFISFLKQHSRHGVVNYQFDGLQRFPSIYAMLDDFDKCYVFDPDDLQTPNHTLLPATNFYFDHNLDTPCQRTTDFYFTGVHMDSRAEAIANFSRYIKTRNKTADINILWKKKQNGRKIYPDDNITLIKKAISFKENLARARRAEVLADFVVSEHKGLSFRTFEALGNRQKLITTNPQVRHYDFYHPDNFLVWDGLDFSQLDDFLEKPYTEIDESIRRKYSFGNWLHYILDIPPYQKITLPK